MSQSLKEASAIAAMLITRKRRETGGSLTPEMIADVADNVIDLLGAGDGGVDRDLLIADLEQSYSTWVGETAVLVDPDEHHLPWLDRRRPDIAWQFWDRYELYLRSKGWPEATRLELDRSTNQVLDLIPDPLGSGLWDRRGLVVGHVQSGKTSHYIGLICKAVDAGYKVIFVLSGMHKSLRSQTQIRLEEGFLGYDISAARRAGGDRGGIRAVGAGLIRDSNPRPDTITSRLDAGDFNRRVADGFAINPGSAPLLFVVKKNGRVLQNILDWIHWAANRTDADGRRFVANVPLLVIDDESDQASIDTNDIAFDEHGRPDEDHDPTVINQRIRSLLHAFDQSAYLGYTATPFANIFIHEKARTPECGEDLFPRSFIVSLPTPSDYVGAARIFGIRRNDDPERSIPGFGITHELSDHAESDDPRENRGWIPPRHRIDHTPRYEGVDQLPPSLRRAIQSYLLATAARWARGQADQHNTMLIHVTRFNAVQEKVYQQVDAELIALQNRLRLGEGQTTGGVLDDLKMIWESDFMQVTPRVSEIIGTDLPLMTWEMIRPHLLRVVDTIKVRVINGTAGDVLDYTEYEQAGQGLNVIAIGGDKLSRGLTLEGLTVSYYLRASKMYDTLMQMSRWFGYRPGYADLCRLYTTADLLRWFEHIAEASEELRTEFDRMRVSGGTPRDYGLRVRAHPQMLVTSRVKMRNGTAIELSFDGDISETIVFHRDSETTHRNAESVKRLLSRLDADGCPMTVGPVRRRPDGKSQRWAASILWEGVASDAVTRLLTDYQTHPGNVRVHAKLLREYIEEQVSIGDLTQWSVLVSGGEADARFVTDFCEVPLVNRGWHGDHFSEAQNRLASERYVIRRLVSGRDEGVDIDAGQYARAMELTVSAWQSDPARSADREAPTTPSAWAFRQVRPKSQGLLIVYPLNPDPDKTRDAAEGVGGPPVMGLAFSFPGNPGAKKVKYIVNNLYYDQELGLSE